MTEITQFPKIKAWPCNLQDMTLLEMLSERQCEESIKETYRDHITSGYVAHRHQYPTEPKDLYLVPFSEFIKSRELGLKPAKFAALWLPSIGSSIAEIREILPEELKESPIIAWEDTFSIFGGGGGRTLHVDPGFGEALFILAPYRMFDYPPDWMFLAELTEN